MSSAAVSFCPSFNSYASERIVNIAAKVSEEFRDEESKSESKVLLQEEDEEEEEYVDEDDEFEFVSTIADLDSRLFLDGEIRQVFPVFNRSLLLNEVCDDHDRGNEGGHAAAALKKLFIDDHDDDDDDAGRQASSSSSSSSSDEDEPEPEPEPNMNVTFCIWSPKRNNNPTSSASPLQSPSRCKKSNSTGSSSSSTPSKKWFKLRDLLRRSNSDGKDSFVFLNKPKNNNNNNNKNSSSNNSHADSSKEKKVKSGKSKAKAKTKAQAAAVSAHEAFYVKNRAIKQGDKKKSYLPYRQDLLGVFANYNGLAKTLPPSF